MVFCMSLSVSQFFSPFRMNGGILKKLIGPHDTVKITGSKVKSLRNLVNVIAPEPLKGFWGFIPKLNEILPIASWVKNFLDIARFSRPWV